MIVMDMEFLKNELNELYHSSDSGNSIEFTNNHHTWTNSGEIMSIVH